jgi:hypothetical protein
MSPKPALLIRGDLPEGKPVQASLVVVRPDGVHRK